MVIINIKKKAQTYMINCVDDNVSKNILVEPTGFFIYSIQSSGMCMDGLCFAAYTCLMHTLKPINICTFEISSNAFR